MRFNNKCDTEDDTPNACDASVGVRYMDKCDTEDDTPNACDTSDRVCYMTPI